MFTPFVQPTGVNGAKALSLQYTSAPLFMSHLQPVGTPGTNGSWGPTATGGVAYIWPDIRRLTRVVWPKIRDGNRQNFTVLQEWFLPRYQAWLANKSVVITTDDTVAALESYPGLWVPNDS